VYWALWQSCWKINSPEFWRVADNSCILKWNLFIITSFNNSLYQFSIVFVIISRRFFVIPSNVIKKSLRLCLLKKLKHLLKFFYLYYRYGPLWVMREFPAKRGKTFGLDKLTTKLLKSGRPSACISQTVHKPNERRDRRFGLKLVCWWMVDILNIGWNAKCDINITN